MYMFAQYLFLDLVSTWCREIPTSMLTNTDCSYDLSCPNHSPSIDWFMQDVERNLTYYSSAALDRFQCFYRLLHMLFICTRNWTTFMEQGLEFIQSWCTSSTLSEYSKKLGMASWPREQFYHSYLVENRDTSEREKAVGARELWESFIHGVGLLWEKCRVKS
jgi:hypothetical protein